MSKFCAGKLRGLPCPKKAAFRLYDSDYCSTHHRLQEEKAMRKANRQVAGLARTTAELQDQAEYKQQLAGIATSLASRKRKYAVEEQEAQQIIDDATNTEMLNKHHYDAVKPIDENHNTGKLNDENHYNAANVNMDLDHYDAPIVFSDSNLSDVITISTDSSERDAKRAKIEINGATTLSDASSRISEAQAAATLPDVESSSPSPVSSVPFVHPPQQSSVRSTLAVAASTSLFTLAGTQLLPWLLSSSAPSVLALPMSPASAVAVFQPAAPFSFVPTILSVLYLWHLSGRGK